MSKTGVEIRERELVEIKRSAIEASLSECDIAPYGDDIFNRYLAPPADTCHPLEYSYHLLGDVRNKVVLDLGCGSGENSLMLARRGANVYAMDISEQLIRIAKRRLAVNGNTKGVSFVIGSAYDIPLADESIDLVFGMAVLHHLELPLAASQVRRVLRRNGRAIFKEPVRNSKFLRFARNLMPSRAPDISPFERPLTDYELEKFADGFRRYRSKAFSLPHLTLCGVLPFPRQCNAYFNRVDRVVLKRLPSMRHFASVRVIELVK